MIYKVVIEINLNKRYGVTDVNTMTGRITPFKIDPLLFQNQIAYAYIILKPNCPDAIYQIRDDPMRQELILKYQETGCTVYSAIKTKEASIDQVVQDLLNKISGQSDS